MKKTMFLSVAGALAAGAAAYLAKLVADEVKKNDGLKPTLDKARDSAAAMIGAAKQHPIVTKTADAVVALRDRIAGSNDNFTGGESGDFPVAQHPTPTAGSWDVAPAADGQAADTTTQAAAAA